MTRNRLMHKASTAWHGFDAIAISGDGAERYVRLTRSRELLNWSPLDSRT